jgi:MarR family transcriptional regulator, organic hydroperoxide resistance regulator
MATTQHKSTAGYLVWRLSMKWRAAVDAAVAPLGLTHAQYSVLASLRGMTYAGQRPSQRELADHTGLDPIYISKLARALEKSGVVARVPW